MLAKRELFNAIELSEAAGCSPAHIRDMGKAGELPKFGTQFTRAGIEAKFGKDKKSYTFRITYRSPERTLTSEEVNKIQEEIREETKKELNAVLR